MSPKKTKKPDDGLESIELWRTGLLAVSLSLLLLLAPIVYRLTSRLTEEDLNQTISSNSVALIVTAVFGAAFMLASNNYIRHITQHVMQDYQQQLQSFHHNQRMSYFYKLFPAFATSSHSNGHTTNDRASSPSSFYSMNNKSHDSINSDSNTRRKIDPKYFKPKFIINELITFWDTTCTVITWGSFYVIGGTIVATEKITQKIKSMPKSPSHRDSSSSFFGGDNRNSSRGTGQSDSSFGPTSSPRGETSTSQQQQQQPQQNQTSQTYRKISAWTKRSISSIKKKYSRAVRSNAPQLTSGPSSDTGSHIFFFASPNSSVAA